MKEIFCRIERCLGCRSCELACATEHSESKELASAVLEKPRPMSRVRVKAVEEKGGKARLRSIALQCRQCAEPACAAACITGAIVKDQETGVVLFTPDSCVGCWECVAVCPHGAILRVTDRGIAVKCDRCLGREIPACVEACPTRALLFCTPEEFAEMEVRS